MNKSTIQTLIDKVIGKKGLIRVPSWWMRKVLMQIADWVQEGKDDNDKKIRKVKKEVDGKISTLETDTNSKISTLETDTNSKISTLETNTNKKISTLETNTNKKISTLETYNVNNDNVLFELIEAANLPISIKCFTVKTESNGGFVYVDEVKQSIPANAKKVIPFDTKFGFGKIGNGINYISFIGFIATDTSAMTNMENMFYYCQKLTSINLSGLNTSAVTNMEGMFSNCTRLTSINLSGLNTSAVTNMKGMFYYCQKLTSLNLSSFDTSAVTSMYYMFFGCTSLTSLNLSSFDTSAVTSMYQIFYDCSSLTSLLLGPNFFKASQVTSVDFSSCTKWTNDTVVTSLVTNSYDRATAGLSKMTLQLSANTKAAITDEQKAAITAKGYTIA